MMPNITDQILIKLFKHFYFKLKQILLTKKDNHFKIETDITDFITKNKKLNST